MEIETPGNIEAMMASVTLVTVESVTATELEGHYSLMIRVALAPDGNEESWPFAYSPTDPYGLSPAIRQWLIDHEGQYTILPYNPPPPPPFTVMVFDMWGRMTDDEAEAFDEAMSTASPLRLRKQFNLAVSMMSDSELFTFTRGVLLSVFTQSRTDAILTG